VKWKIRRRLIMKVLKALFIFLLFFVWLNNSSFAHDTDLYIAEGQGIEPNILIMFDNSISMGESVTTRYYNNAVTYDPGPVPIANRDAVYRKQGSTFNPFADSIADVLCARARTALINNGHYSGGTSSSCGGSSRTLWTGNYRNYIDSGGDQSDTKINIAQTVITDFLAAITGVRIGAIVFNVQPGDGDNNSEGGHIQTTIKSLTPEGVEELTTDINAIRPETYTPLAETLYEAGLYFKGGASYFNPGTSYVSPIQYACQKNYVIIITDGNSTQDRNSVLANGATRTIDGVNVVFPAIGDRDGDQREPIGAHNDPGYSTNGSDFLDDVAKYLYDTDLRSDLTGSQNIITYTIGFTDLSNVDLLERTAAHGHGKYFYAQDAQSLSSAFQNIVDEILEETSSFVAPVVPVDRMERTQSGHYIYIALFKPKNHKMWSGNVKKYEIDDNGDILDATGRLAIDPTSHQFYEAIRSFWTSSSLLDGGDAEQGGIGEILMNRDFSVFDPGTGRPRKIYTYLGSNSDLTNSTNRFDTTHITPSKLGLGADSDPSAQLERDRLVKFVYGYDAYDEDGNSVTNEKRDWILGSFLHSKPFIVHYDSMDVIFAGANDGMLHAFNDSNGEELWGFIPPDVLQNLQALHADVLQMFVDGSPKCYISRNTDGTISKVILIFGLRRGGNHYYALDVTDPLVPRYLWEIDPNATGSLYAKMGQSWSTPNMGQVACSTGAPNCTGGRRWVAFIGGGFDTSEDLDTPPASDTLGTAVYVVDIFDGSPVMSFTPDIYPGMTRAIPSDIARVDTNYDGKIDRLYAGDLGGRMWRFNIGDPDPALWSASVLFTAPSGTKIFYPPDVTLEWNSGAYEMLFFGTGDREHPKDSTVADRFYSIKDKSEAGTLTEDNLYDLTSDELQQTGTTQETINQILAQLNSANGWLIQLDTGEKCLSPAVVFNKEANFTTYTPPSESTGDPCFVGEGIGKVYVVDYLTACAVIDFDGSGILTASDRYDTAGHGIPSGVVIAILPNTIMEYTGIGGGIYYRRGGGLQGGTNIKQYWKIIF
jgi:type IV pilus assembly protein PilY1